MILTAKDIRKMDGMVTPLTEPGKFLGTSYGISVAGVDLRLGSKFLLQTHVPDAQPVSPICQPEGQWVVYANDLILPPGGFVLAETQETLCIPRNVVGLLKDKSTLARIGLSVFNTVFEPGWRGVPTIEIKNQSVNPVRLTSGVGIAQMLFLQTTGDTAGYSGKYQDQTGVTEAKA